MGEIFSSEPLAKCDAKLEKNASFPRSPAWMNESIIETLKSLSCDQIISDWWLAIATATINRAKSTYSICLRTISSKSLLTTGIYELLMELVRVGEIQWFLGIHGPPTPVGQGPCEFDKGRSLDLKTGFSYRLFIHIISSHKDSSNVWHLISQLRTVLNRIQMVPDWQGSAAHEIPNHWISPTLRDNRCSAQVTSAPTCGLRNLILTSAPSTKFHSLYVPKCRSSCAEVHPCRSSFTR